MRIFFSERLAGGWEETELPPLTLVYGQLCSKIVGARIQYQGSRFRGWGGVIYVLRGVIYVYCILALVLYNGIKVLVLYICGLDCRGVIYVPKRGDTDG